MSTISLAKKKSGIEEVRKPRSGYLTTTEFAKLCGVSRFTIINWTKRGKIKAIRTVGKHFRIPVSEVLAVLKSFDDKKNSAASGLEEPVRQRPQTIPSDNVECGNCLNEKDDNTQEKTKKKNFLYNFAYGVGRGVQRLKRKGKVK